MITKEQLAADKALCEKAQTECLPVDRFACGNRLPEYIAELEATRERIEQLEYVDLAGYLHNHGMPCTVEAIATRRLFLDVLRGTEQGKRDPSPTELVQRLQETEDALLKAMGFHPIGKRGFYLDTQGDERTSPGVDWPRSAALDFARERVMRGTK